MKVYNKAVRDRIPDIIRATGSRCDVRVMDTDEWVVALSAKLSEEVEEYRASGDIEELADLVEVVYGILAARGVSLDEFEATRRRKEEERGGFGERLFLVRAD